MAASTGEKQSGAGCVLHSSITGLFRTISAGKWRFSDGLRRVSSLLSEGYLDVRRSDLLVFRWMGQ